MNPPVYGMTSGPSGTELTITAMGDTPFLRQHMAMRRLSASGHQYIELYPEDVPAVLAALRCAFPAEVRAELEKGK